MKCLSTEAPPKGAVAVAVTAAILLQSYGCFAEGETAGFGHSSMTDDQILHWLSQPENRSNTKIKARSADEEKTELVVEISNADRSAAGATSSLNGTIPSANTAIPLTELPPAQDALELTALPAMAPESDLTADLSPAAQPLDDEKLSANGPDLSTYTSDVVNNGKAEPAELPAAQDYAYSTALLAMPASPDLPADPGLETQPLADDKLPADSSGPNNYTSDVVNGDVPPTLIVPPHAVHNARLAMQAAGGTLDGLMSSRRTGMDKGHGFSNRGVWMQYSHNNTSQDVKNSIPGYRAKTNGFSIGADSVLENNRDIRTGIAYTYARGNVNGENSTNSTIDTDTNIFSIYTSSQEDNYFFDGRLSYAFGKNSGQRTVAGKRLDANYRSRSWGVGLTGGCDMELKDSWYWQPKVAFNYYSIDTDDYSESSGDPDQTPSFDQVSSERYSILELGAGMSLLADLAIRNGVIRPELGVMAFHDFKKDPIEVTAHYTTGGESFPIYGARRIRNRYQAEAALNVNVLDDTICALSYSYHWASQFRANNFIARISYEF